MINKEICYYIYPKKNPSFSKNPEAKETKEFEKVKEEKYIQNDSTKEIIEPIRIRKHSISHNEKENKTKKKEMKYLI